jgi:predicted nucleic acid-binding protein
MIFIDTSAFYALIDKNDINHQHAVSIYKKNTINEVLCTSVPVVTETWFLLNSRLSDYCANTFMKSISEGLFELLPVELNDVIDAMRIKEKYIDSAFSFADATSFAICDKNNIRIVFSFDKHFKIYRPSFGSFIVCE